MIALIDLEDNSIVQVFDTAPKELVLPNKQGWVSPVVVGWEGGGELTYDKNGQASEGPPRYKVVEIEEDVKKAPEGQQIADKLYEFDDVSGRVVETTVLEAAPVPTKMTDVEILEQSVGLTVDQIKSLLGLK